MARPREFDEDVVLDRARNAFWSNGVAATSISALSSATGLSVGSIYKAFASKDQLCAMTLEDYTDTARAGLADTLRGAASPTAGLRAWFKGIAAAASDPSPTRGCYAVELAAERAAVDERIRAILVDHDRRLLELVADTVRRGVDAGELIGEPEAVARLLTATVNGIQVEARKGISYADAMATFDVLLA
ncbi:MAG: TetR/AcrR family transcriptional regulator, partial [Actinomycetota bacterium]